jgi:hypothetical protein
VTVSAACSLFMGRALYHALTASDNGVTCHCQRLSSPAHVGATWACQGRAPAPSVIPRACGRDTGKGAHICPVLKWVCCGMP